LRRSGTFHQDLLARGLDRNIPGVPPAKSPIHGKAAADQTNKKKQQT